MSPNSPQNGIFFKEQAIMLQNCGNEVVLLDCTERGRKDYLAHDNFHLKKYIDDGLNVYQLCYPNLFLTKTPRLKRRLAQYRLKKVFYKAVQENGKPDGVICHGFIMANNVLTSGIIDCPVITVEHSSYVLNKRLSVFQISMLKDDINLTDSFLCVSDALKEAVVQLTGVQEARIGVLQNPINALFSNVNVDTFKPRENTFRFICVATINAESKGIKMLIDSFCSAFNEQEGVELLILGDGKDYDAMVQLVKDKGRERQISMPGRVGRQKVRDYLCSSDVFVLPSKYETFGIAYIEALACGLPVITQKNGGSNQIVTEKNGILLDKGTVENYSKAMKSILNTIDTYDKKVISETCIKKYSEQTYCERITDIIEAVANKKRCD